LFSARQSTVAIHVPWRRNEVAIIRSALSTA
jgi:hypothetical protein